MTEWPSNLMKDLKSYNKLKNFYLNHQSLKMNLWCLKTQWLVSEELLVKCRKNFPKKPARMISWQFTKVKLPLSPKRKKKINKNLDVKSNKCQDWKLKSVKNNNKLIKSRVLGLKRINLKIIWVNLNKRKQNMPNVNNKLKKSNGKPATCPELNSYWKNKRPDMKNHSALCKAKDLLLTSQLKMHLFKKSINKLKNFFNKLERKKVHWLQNWKRKNKFFKSLKLLKTNTRLKSNHF